MDDEIIIDNEALEENGTAGEPGNQQAPEETKSPAPIQSYKVKVDGKEVEVDLDTLLSGYQQSAASQQRFQQAAMLQKQIDEVIGKAKEDPTELFNFLGLNPKEWSESYLLKQLEEELMSPEDKAQRDKDRELESYRKQAAEAKKQQEELAKQQAYNQVITEIDNDITDAIKAAGIKPTPKVVARVAEQMLISLESTGMLPKASNILKDVQVTTQQELLEFLQALPEDQLLNQLPKSVVDMLRKQLIKQAKANVPSSPTRAVKPSASTKEKKLKSLDELLD